MARVRDVHPAKQPSPKLVTLSGKVIEVRDAHIKKQASPKLVTPSGILIEVRALQLVKAYEPKLVTPSGKVIEVSDEHPLKEYASIEEMLVLLKSTPIRPLFHVINISLVWRNPV